MSDVLLGVGIDRNDTEVSLSASCSFGMSSSPGKLAYSNLAQTIKYFGLKLFCFVVEDLPKSEFSRTQKDVQPSGCEEFM